MLCWLVVLSMVLSKASSTSLIDSFFPDAVGPGCVFVGVGPGLGLANLLGEMREETPVMIGGLASNHSVSQQLSVSLSWSRSLYSRCSHLMLVVREASDLASTLDISRLDNFVNAKHVFVLTQAMDVDAMAAIMAKDDFELLRNALLVSPGSVKGLSLVWGRDVVFGAEEFRVIHLLKPQRKLDSDLFLKLTMDLRAMNLSAATFPLPPFSVPNQSGQYEGFEVKVLDSVASKLNFRYTTTSVSGTWNGLVDHLANERSHVGFAHFFLTEERKRRIDFSDTFDTDYYCFLVYFIVQARKPSAQPSWLALVLPFTLPLWLMLIVTLLSSMAVMLVMASIYDQEFTSSMAGIFVLGAFVDESQPEFMVRLRRPWMKLSVLLFLLGVFVLSSGYRGSLVSFLTAPIIPQPLDTLQQVVDSPLPVGSMGNVIKANLHRSPEPLFQRFDKKYSLYRNMGIGSMNEAFEQAHEGNIVMFENKQMLQYRVAKDYTNRFGESHFHLARECSKPFNICFGLTKHSLLTPIVNVVLVALKEGGLVAKYFDDFKGNENNEQGDEDNEIILTLQHLQGVFVLTAIGVAAGSVVFAIEIGLCIMRKNKKM